MSYLDKLLKGIEVGWMTLGELAELVRGNGLQKKDFTETGVPAIHYGQIYTYYNLCTTETKSFVSPELAKTLKKVDTGDIVITNTSENLEDVGKAVVYLGNVQAVTGGHATVIKPGPLLLGKYFAYFTQTAEFANQKRIFAKGTKVIDVSATDMSKIWIPIPCPNNPNKSLEIQNEIVLILDSFAELATKLRIELTAELTARKQQYVYYRDHLLSFKELEVEWKSLREIGDVKMCKRILKNETRPEGEVPFYKIGTFGKKADSYISRNIYNLYKSRFSFPKKGDVLISASGTIGRAVVYNGEPAYFQDSNIVWIDNDETIVTNEYLFHFYKVAKWFVSEGGTIDRLYNENIRRTKIPVPYSKNPKQSLTEQARIVAILDKFDTLSRSISEDLAREISLRQEQYEYYRDLLLTFPKDNLPV